MVPRFSPAEEPAKRSPPQPVRPLSSVLVNLSLPFASIQSFLEVGKDVEVSKDVVEGEAGTALVAFPPLERMGFVSDP